MCVVTAAPEVRSVCASSNLSVCYVDCLRCAAGCLCLCIPPSAEPCAGALCAPSTYLLFVSLTPHMACPLTLPFIGAKCMGAVYER